MSCDVSELHRQIHKLEALIAFVESIEKQSRDDAISCLKADLVELGFWSDDIDSPVCRAFEAGEISATDVVAHFG
jgi:hypothetical protein